MANNLITTANISANPSTLNSGVTSLVNPDIVKNLKSSNLPQSFGDQLTNNSQKITTAISNSKLAQLLKEKKELIEEEIKLDIEYQKQKTTSTSITTFPTSSLSLSVSQSIFPQQTTENAQNFSNQQLTPDEIREKNYNEAKKNIQERKKINQQEIDNILKDPFAEQKKKNKERQERVKKLKVKTDEEKIKAQKERVKAVLQNAKKTLTPILLLSLTNKLSEIIKKNNTIKKLVDDTNKIIIEANESNDPNKLNNAKIVRDNAIRVIQSNIDKINKINEQLKTISTIVNIFNVIVNIVGPPLLSTPVPSPAPDVVTIPKETFRRKVYEPALKTLNSLSAALPVVTVCLQKLISILEGYRSQLLNINGQLETQLPPIPVEYGTGYGSYKGFTFALREENNPKFVVQGNKRHYAVAINKQNIEQLKSEPSFTLDPNDLIEQLKLVIDQQNLQG